MCRQEARRLCMGLTRACTIHQVYVVALVVIVKVRLSAVGWLLD